MCSASKASSGRHEHRFREACPQPDETSVLLPNPPTACPSHEQDGRYVLPTFLGEVFQLARDSIPVILAYALQNSLQATSILIVGRTSPEDLATAAFSFMFAAVTGWMIALGGTTALDTLASSTFTASANKHDLGVLLQRGFLVLGLFYLPVAGLWACAEPVFLLLGQQPQLSRDSARFLTCLIPGGLGYIYFELMKKYLQAQGCVELLLLRTKEYGG